MTTVFGIDVGTNSVKGIAVDENGNVIDSSIYQISMETPRPSGLNRIPSQWNAVTVVLKALASKNGAYPLQYLLVDRCILSLRSMKKVMSFIPRFCGVIRGRSVSV